MRRPLVLVADSDDTERVLLKTLLQHRGFDVSECRDGPAAVWLAADLQPDAIVVDAGLPIWDGWTVAQRVSGATAATRRIPIVFLSAYGGTVAEARARAAGSACYLPKPVDPAEIVYLLTELTASSRSVTGASRDMPIPREQRAP